MVDPAQEQQFDQIIKCLSDAGNLGDVIITGSWAEHLYQNGGMLEFYYPEMKTSDMDVLIPNVNRTGKRSEFIALAKEEGFIYDEDYISGHSRLIGQNGFTIEFLAPQRGSGDRPLPRAEIGVNAQQLSHMSMLSRFKTEVEYKEYTLQVPQPEAYVVHKMILGREKDRERIYGLLPDLNPQQCSQVCKFLTTKERKMLHAYISENRERMILHDDTGYSEKIVHILYEGSKKIEKHKDFPDGRE